MRSELLWIRLKLADRDSFERLHSGNDHRHLLDVSGHFILGPRLERLRSSQDDLVEGLAVNSSDGVAIGVLQYGKLRVCPLVRQVGIPGEPIGIAPAARMCGQRYGRFGF